MITDPARKLKTDPGDPDVCPLHQIHKLIGSQEVILGWEECCRSAECGCVAHKRALSDELNAYLADFGHGEPRLPLNPAMRGTC